MGDWDEQFEKSLARFAERETHPHHATYGYCLRVAREMAGFRAAENQLGYILHKTVIGQCKSPIEQALMVALIFVAHEDTDCEVLARHHTEHSTARWFAFPSLDWFDEDFTPGVEGHVTWPARVTIDPQAKVGCYRADFLLNLSEGVGWSKNPRAVGAVIECDGHDFHERTKEQARHDKARDRFIQQEGLLVLRYAGSEIWADPVACAQNAMGVLNARLDALRAEQLDMQLRHSTQDAH